MSGHSVAPPHTLIDTDVPLPSDSARGATRIGWLIILLFFGGFGLWAAIAPLNGAVVADGVVTVEGNRKSVQHLQGGIVKEIKVKDGDSVQAGQTLLLLDDTTARAQYDIYFQQLALARATEARLTAELSKAEAVEFPQDLVSSTDPFVQKALQSQKSEFDTRRAALVGNTSILRRRIDQLTEQNAGNDGNIRAYQDQLTSMQAEEASLDGLLKSGLTTRSRILDLQRAEASLQGQIGDAKAALAANNQHIEEFKQQIDQLTSDQQSEVSRSLDDTQSKILDIAPQLQNAQTVLDRMTVRAPTEGKVVGLSVHTIGAVVAPGAVIMEIVPERTSLVVQARVAVQDISDLRPGMKAEVRFTSYKQRTTPLIRGTVADISADRITDEKTLAAYYQTQIALDPADLAANPEIVLYPGMPTTVLVTTQERTALDYFLGPLISSFDHAFKQK